jgi:flagellin-like hook-associated protein FlgL
MKRANDLLSKSLQRLSSGKRIVSPADDAGGLAVGLKLQSSLRRAQATMMNAQNGVSFLQMQDGAMKVAGEIVDRMSELKAFFNDVSKNAMDRETYNHEFHELQKELNTLKAQKFNGVSLFAMTESSNGALKISTSDDGLGEKVELSRTGFFENLKSKFGADSVLNSGSQGSYRQLVGNFTEDGGVLDANPGNTARSYSSGQVVYKQGVADADSGYFMALTDVAAGTKIEDSYEANSKWIRLADKTGKGFAESYPDASVYSEFSQKQAATGESVAYLKGDIVKVPAHWSSPGSYVYLEAQTDVPRGLTSAELFDNYIGSNGYFEMVGQDRSNGAIAGDKPTTEFNRANGDLAEPDLFANDTTDNAKDSLKLAMENAGASSNFTPGYVKADGEIYQANHDWNINQWNGATSLNSGEFIFESSPDIAREFIKQTTDNVKGLYNGSAANAGEYVSHDGKWYLSAAGINSSVSPVDPERSGASRTVTVADQTAEFKAGDFINIENDHDGVAAGAQADEAVFVASDLMKGNFDADNITWGSWVRNDGAATANSTPIGEDAYVQLAASPDVAFGAAWANGNGEFDQIGTAYVTGDVVSYGGSFYKTSSNLAAGTAATALSLPTEAPSQWTKVNLEDVLGGAGAYTGGVATLGWDTTAVEATTSAWTRVEWDYIDSPQNDPGFATDVTEDFSNLNNEDYWSRTHFGSLQDITVGTNYQRGDNIHYQGKNYIYTSHLPSNDPLYVDPTNSGYTEFERLLELNAVVELPMYVDTIAGGGSADLPEGVYYRPNQDLEFIDRLPDTGTVRTNSIARRTDAPNPPGDEIYNSQDDQFYGGLNAGNDGIYGTMDDFYATTTSPDVAAAGAHVDADADNNKDLLDTSNGLEDFSVADFVDYIQTIANFRAVNGGTMSRLGYATRILEENQINLEAATSRIMDADMAAESTRMAQQNVLLQAGASMVTQANSLNNIVLSLLQ